jgi:hypothetical protein
VIAGAVRQWLMAGGLTPVHISAMPDYRVGAGVVFVVHDEPERDESSYSDAGRPWYLARVQIRCRADNHPAAWAGADAALKRLHAAVRQVLPWTPPPGVPARSYRIEHVETVTRPTYIPTPEPGYMATTNAYLHVREQ